MTNAILRFLGPDGRIFEERPGTISDAEHVKPGQIVRIENGNRWRAKYVEQREDMLKPTGFTPFITLEPVET